jgi:hypothetical protein
VNSIRYAILGTEFGEDFFSGVSATGGYVFAALAHGFVEVGVGCEIAFAEAFEGEGGLA